MTLYQFRRLVFFWIASFVLATIGFYLLNLIIPARYIFGSLYRMYQYHLQHPIQYIAIPCFFYGIIATILSNRFSRQGTGGQIMLAIIITALTIIISSPFGGMLWHLHDMQAGYFPHGWMRKMINDGFALGISFGWQIIVLSVPYNLIGLVGCFFLTRKGSNLFRY